jgi:hypothetical protein
VLLLEQLVDLLFCPDPFLEPLVFLFLGLFALGDFALEFHDDPFVREFEEALVVGHFDGGPDLVDVDRLEKIGKRLKGEGLVEYFCPVQGGQEDDSAGSLFRQDPGTSTITMSGCLFWSFSFRILSTAPSPLVSMPRMSYP